MMKPRFSIITCTLNSEPWLRTCVESVLMQEDISFEYILVDGGSIDGTLDYLRNLQTTFSSQSSPRIKRLDNVAGGISRAMNAGMEIASGDIIAHLHSDDFYLRKDVLATVDHAFQTTACRWLFGRTMSVIEGELHAENYQAPRYSRAQLLRGNFIPHPATFVSRALMWEAGFFDTRLKYAMDYDLWLRLSNIAEPCQIALPLTAFREHAGSLSTRERSKAMAEDFQVRLSHSGINPFARLSHLARYCVRRRRAQLAMNGASHA